MKKIVFLILGISILIGGCKKNRKKEEARSMPTPEILVNTPVEKNITYTYEYPAYLQAIQTVNLVARVSGYLEKMNYIPGVPVKAGDLLFVIEPQPYRDQLNAALAQLKSTEARLTYAQAQYERMKEARPSKAISEIDYIQSEADYRSALANLQDAKAQVNTARTNLNYSYIKAPFDGRVSRNLVDVQNFVAGSVQPVTLATMYKDKTMFAYFNMAYAEFQTLPRIVNPLSNSDSTIHLTIVDAVNPGRHWNGKLDYSSPNVDLQTGTVTVRAIIDNPKEELLSGMYVKIRVPYKEVKNALLIPEASIGTNQAGRYVYLVDQNDKVLLQTVQVGVLESDGMREILSGVTPDDWYVVEAMMSVRPDMKVKPVFRTRNQARRNMNR